MDALEYVEMLATLDRQIAGLENSLHRLPTHKNPEGGLPAETAVFVRRALARWREIREIVAEQNETPTRDQLAAALRKLLAEATAAMGRSPQCAAEVHALLKEAP